ncbi:DUF7916 family protein [Brachyspira hyodysenteriae]|uniref:DUF7916 family protein n=1 Tax=Brachyspira hyodysenteriae TaxID=159 RepID=UPI00118395D9|nr:hypothetical protein [Brachyspira hyodysenteriae]TVL64103.1 hypothetical protein A9X85_10585 [Brachyspira hyodysenteriae]TVL77295.1 hypothetical protein A9X79_08630 [Brachyspira hyodysenteriae]
MKRIFELNYTDTFNMDTNTLIETIRNSEGRTLMAESLIYKRPLIERVTDPEILAAMGVDLITLNIFDLLNPFIYDLDEVEADESMPLVERTFKGQLKLYESSRKKNDHIQRIKKYTGRFIGINLEPVGEGVDYPEGLKATKDNYKRALDFGIDYIVLTGNPHTKVSMDTIAKATEELASIAKGKMMIVAGKMHGAGAGNTDTLATVKQISDAGADVIMFGAPGTLPGYTVEKVHELIDEAKRLGMLTKTAIGTAQEGAPIDTIKQIALMSKMAGADIMHIGDAGVGGISSPMNAMAISLVLRGEVHTYRRMALRR